MKRSYLLVLICSFLFVNSQMLKGNQSMLVLDRYTVPLNVKGAKVGQFQVESEEAISLLKDDSGLFEIVDGQSLSLKKGKQITEDSPMTFEIVVEYNGEEISFDIVKDEFIKNKVVAHRGAWKHTGQSQNSLGSLQAAIDLGCEGSELDVWLTKDGQIVLFHDNDCEGRVIEKTTLEDLRKIPLDNGEVMPTLKEYINLIKTQNKTRLVVELKSIPSSRKILALADSVVNLVHQMRAQAWVDYISFDYRGIQKVRAKDATAHTAYLEPKVDLDIQKLDGVSGIDYHYSVYDKMDRLVDRCKMLGLTTNVWTVNDESILRRFVDVDVDFITTDEPQVLLGIIQRR